LTTKTATQAVENHVEPPRYGVRRLDAVLDHAGSGLARSLHTPLPESPLTTEAPKPTHSLPESPLTTETGTQAVENGVEPPYSILLLKAPPLTTMTRIAFSNKLWKAGRPSTVMRPVSHAVSLRLI